MTRLSIAGMLVGCALWSSLGLIACGPREVAPDTAKEIPVRLLRVTNPDLPAFNHEQLEIFLAEAQRFAKDQLGLRLRWYDLGEVSIEEFFRDYYPVVFPENRTDDPFVLDIIEANPVHSAKLAKALLLTHEDDSFEELMAFATNVLPVRRLEAINTKDALMEEVARHHLTSLAELTALPAPRKPERRLLDPGRPFHQYVYWDAAIERVRRFDFVLTNQLLASAEVVDASIHSSLRGGITTGFTERSHATYGGTVILSTYPVLGMEEPLVRMRGESYEPEEAARYLGAYSAHEFGHLFLHYGHPFDHPACIMNPARALRYGEWYREIDRAPSAPACRERHEQPFRGLFLKGRPLWERSRDTLLRLLDRLQGN